MSSTTIDSVVACAAGTGAATWSMGGLFERLVSGKETGGQLGVSLVTQPLGIATPLHVHTREAEAWYLLEGTLTYQAGDERVDLEPGGFIYLPRNVPPRVPHHRDRSLPRVDVAGGADGALRRGGLARGRTSVA
jgi:quercetin dioxygenase-like cupin family protein